MQNNCAAVHLSLLLCVKKIQVADCDVRTFEETYEFVGARVGTEQLARLTYIHN